jgi:hypothetical protein
VDAPRGSARILIRCNRPSAIGRLDRTAAMF